MPDVAQSVQWVRLGLDLFSKALTELPDDQLSAPSNLPGWSRADLAAHVVERLQTYAAALGSTAPTSAPALAPAALREAYRQAATTLKTLLSERPNRSDWADTVTLEDTEQTSGDLAWFLARELLVHAVDLGADEVTFTSLPTEFLGALIDEVVGHRAEDGSPALEILSQDTGEAWRLDGVGEPLRVMAPAAAMAAWLIGRDGGKVKVLGPGDLPVLPRWL